MSLAWITVTDENGVEFDALSKDAGKEDGVAAWVFTDKASGFKDDVGKVNYKTDLKKLPDGNYGA